MIVRLKAIICLLATALIVTVLNSCNTARNNAATRVYQAFLTRYNVHYNGQKHYDDTLEDMEKGYQDDYDNLVPIHPAEARGSESLPQPIGDFTRTIEKAEKAIQLHSIKKAPRGRARTAEQREWKSRSEYNPYLHNSWMLMGKALYMQGEFQKAAIIFLYISRHFRWLPSTVAEAKIWEACCYCAMGWLYEARNVLDNVDSGKLTTKESRRQYYMVQSSLAIRSKDYAVASKTLREAVALSSGSQKTRLRYLLGQVLALGGDKDAAYKEFSKISGNITTDYRTRMSARIAMSEVTQPSKVNDELIKLERLTKYASNGEYLDRIYFAIGNLQLQKKDTVSALIAYEKSLSHSTSYTPATAVSELAIGKIYYERHEYVKAQPYYSSAVISLPQDYPDIKEIKKLSDILDRYAVYAKNVSLQDSLLKLADMPEKERLAVCRRLAEEYVAERKKEESNTTEDISIGSQGTARPSRLLGSAMQPTIPAVGNLDASWYFYNPQMVRDGRTRFQQIWGNRRLEDNWRRRDRTSSYIGEDIFDNEKTEKQDNNDINVDEDNDAGNERDVVSRDNPGEPEYYLKDIPLTDNARTHAEEIISDGLYHMGLILANDLHDVSMAKDVLMELMTRFPDNPYRMEVYNDLYLISVRDGRMDEAEKYRLNIVNEFPDSPLGMAMSKPDYLDRLTRQGTIQDSLYVKAYDAYIENNNKLVHEITEKIKEDYPTSTLMPKFMFLDALAHATDGDRNKFGDGLNEILMRYPDADLAPLVSGMMRNLKSGMQLGDNNSNFQGTIWDIKVSDDALMDTIKQDESKIEFSMDENGPHLYVFVLPTDNARMANQLLYGVGKHNFETFMTRDFDIELRRYGELTLLIVSGLNNRQEALRYGTLIDEDDGLEMPSNIGRLVISSVDFDKIVDNELTLGQYVREMEGKAYTEAQLLVLPEDLYEIEQLDY